MLEVVVSILLLSIGVVASMSALEAVSRTESKVNSADTLQRLACEKLNDVRVALDPTNVATSGDFTDQGHKDVTWQVSLDETSASFVEQVSVTATKGKDSQTVSTLIYLAASAESSASTASTTTSGGG